MCPVSWWIKIFILLGNHGHSIPQAKEERDHLSCQHPVKKPASVMAWEAYKSGKATLMLNNIYRFWGNICCQPHVFWLNWPACTPDLSPTEIDLVPLKTKNMTKWNPNCWGAEILYRAGIEQHFTLNRQYNSLVSTFYMLSLYYLQVIYILHSIPTMYILAFFLYNWMTSLICLNILVCVCLLL